MATNGTNGTIAKSSDTTSLLSPTALCHVVLKTTEDSYKALVDWYLTFLGAKITHQNSRITFMTYDYEHHRIAIVGMPGLTRPDPPQSGTGLAHIAFGFDTLEQLATSYEQKKAHGIVPVWAVNHGLSISFYYEDPDGSQVETQVDAFDTKEEGMTFIEGEQFAENPIGVDFDPEVFLKRVRSGEDHREIKKRPNIGKRMTRAEKAGVMG